MHPDVIALVALEGEDSAVEALETRLRSLEPRLHELERTREVAATALARAKQTLTSEQEKLGELKARVAESRKLQERNQKQLDTITNVREASAASAQLDQSRKMAADADGEAARITVRVEDAKSRLAQEEQAMSEIETSQESERSRRARGSRSRSGTRCTSRRASPTRPVRRRSRRPRLTRSAGSTCSSTTPVPPS